MDVRWAAGLSDERRSRERGKSVLCGDPELPDPAAPEARLPSRP